MLNVFLRKDLEEREKLILKLYASFSADSKGRVFLEEENPYRLCFQRDRDRIIHSRAFRRLKLKTQVFFSLHGDHYRTRLTHTIEVSQVSRGLARSLGLNEDLAEAIALAHDLGHTPFGHAGESAMREIMKEFGLSFEHNEQSKRIVEKLEKVYPEFDGLNLTYEVMEGLMKHYTPWDHPSFTYSSDVHISRPSLEAEIVNLADEIAYQSHDIDDGLRSKLFSMIDLKKIDLWLEAEELVRKKYTLKLSSDLLKGRIISKLITLMIADVLKQSDDNISNYAVSDHNSLKKCLAPIVSFSSTMREKSTKLRKFLRDYFYLHPKIKSQMEEGKKTIKSLFWFYYNHFQDFQNYFSDEKKIMKDEKKAETIKDYIAGMTDSYVFSEYAKYFSA